MSSSFRRFNSNGVIGSQLRSRLAHAMLMQEHHDLAHDLLLGPGVRDALGAYRANARHLAQALRLGFDRVEYLLSESPNEFLGVDRADTPDHAGAEVSFDAINRCR